jgi:hypothetical protein
VLNDMELRDIGGNDQVVFFMQGGVMAVRDASGVNHYGSTVLQTNVWHTLEAHVANSSTGIIEIRVEGQLVNEITLNPINTRATSSTYHYVRISAVWDDLIVYDTSGSVNNSWVGDKGVMALLPDSIGDVNQWAPQQASINRFYFPVPKIYYSSGHNGYPAQVFPTPDAQWDVLPTGGSVLQGELVGNRRLTTLNRQDTYSGSSTWNMTAGQDGLIGQYVSAPIAAQTITGTVKMQMITLEPGAAFDERSQLVIRVVSGDGLTVRGVLYAGDTSGLTSEWASAGTVTNRKFPQAAVSPATLSSVVAQNGDRIVVEWGFRAHATGNAGGTFTYMGDSGATDLPEDETDTSQAKNPWIEFSNAITMSSLGDWEYVEESGQGPDEDKSYIQSSTLGDRDLYNLGSVLATYTQISAIAIKTRAKQLDAGPRSLLHAYKSGGTEGASAPLPVSSSYGVQASFYDLDPTDSNPWTQAKLNALQVGPKVG